MTKRTPGELADALDRIDEHGLHGRYGALREAATVLRGIEGERVEGVIDWDELPEPGHWVKFWNLTPEEYARKRHVAPAILTILHRTEGET